MGCFGVSFYVPYACVGMAWGKEERKMSFVEFKDLSFKYKDEAVLKNISLKIEKGSFTVLCGRSGSGKTTLLKFLKPSLRPYGYMAGDIVFEKVFI